ncbi:MAG: efflux RND transporter periplasmic adaptor subunit [Caulobacter sp.]|nr:efflux RND transporter periplasmic adaptor subunit [Caulobacter sp.]
MKIERHWLLTAIAVLAALSVGYGAAQLGRGSAVKADAHGEKAGHEEAGGGGAGEGVVALSPAKAAAAGVMVVGLARGGGAELLLAGKVGFAPGAEAVVDAPLPGAVLQVHVGAGAVVRAGSPLVTLRSPEGAAARATLDAAAAGAEAAGAAARRDQALFDKGYVARSRLDITQAEARRAEAEVRAARARLTAWGSPGADGRVVVRSPVSGVVTRVNTTPGQVLHEEDQEVAAVADAGRVELVFEAPPAAAGVLRVGDAVNGRTADGQVVAGVVMAIAPVGPGGTVTVRARPTGPVPAAGTVISARVAAGRGAAVGGGALVVPSEAVQTVEGVASVFVVEGEAFRARPVTVGRTAEGRTEILSGLTGTERIAGPGAFLLKAELAKGEAEHGH